MTKDDPRKFDSSRRALLQTAALGAISSGLGASVPGVLGGGSAHAALRSAEQRPAAGSPYNILFMLVDQERYFGPGELPLLYSRPGHEKLTKNGVVFENHQINSCVCTPSRSVIYTGQHLQKTGVFDNTNFPWSTDLSPDINTIGDLLREAGYYTAYKGKWHLTKAFEEENELGAPTKIFTREMEAYGFSDYLGIGDIIAHVLGGYKHDGIISAMGVNWLRTKGQEMASEGKPWFLAVNFVNPHDVMFYNTDMPGQSVQNKPGPMSEIARDPNHPLYAQQWAFELPASHDQRLDAPGRPRAHDDFLRSHDIIVGHVPNEPDRWRRRHNYYLNCMRDVDRNIENLLDELEALGLASTTIVVLTADHGDIDGAHQLHAKGTTAYREQNNVPLIVVHPAYRGGERCKAVTSHLDLAPTLVAMTNATPDKKAAIVKGLSGKDFSPLLAAPKQADYNAVRDGALFNYNMLAYLDGEFAEKAIAFVRGGGNKADLKQAGIVPNLMKRGAIRSVFDGRYKMARYFSPKQHHRPASIEELFKFNDIELFDLERDPHEMNNLAMDPKKHGELTVAMNDKLNRLIDAEVGEDNGQFLPGGIDGGWAIPEGNS